MFEYHELPYQFIVTCMVTRGLPNGYMLSMKYQVNVWLRDGYMLVTCRLRDEKT